ncbi:MAG: peroxiredoxin family protein [Nannocystaceae bacterium]|nr:peroxiredoxin family protein [Nannocystaceae bacterium]
MSRFPHSAAKLALLVFASASAACAPPPKTGESATATANPTDNASGGVLDESRLDRSAQGQCGYPAGPYGTDVGDRLANTLGFNLEGCDGDVVEFDSFMCPEAGNKALLINIGAGWCGPCQEETLEFPELYDEFEGQGLEILQVMFQDWTSQLPTSSFCEDWRAGQWEGGAVDLDLAFPVLVDQTNEWTGVYLQDPQAATPINMLIDANGNIRWKSEGQKVELDVLRTQIGAVLASPYEVP